MLKKLVFLGAILSLLTVISLVQPALAGERCPCKNKGKKEKVEEKEKDKNKDKEKDK
jgi:hypothetical protein